MIATFFNSPFGTYFKAFLAVFFTLVLTQMASGRGVLDLDWGVVLNGAMVSFLPVIINALNPRDKRYGRKKTV